MKNPSLLHMPLGLPKTKVMVTMGRDSCSEDELRSMTKAGATIFRFNAARFKPTTDGGYKIGDVNALDLVQTIRRLEIDFSRPLLTYIDLAGPKLRVSEVRGGKDRPEVDDPVKIFFDHVSVSSRLDIGPGDPAHIFLENANHDFFVGLGKEIEFKDGWLVVNVEREEVNGNRRCFHGKVVEATKEFDWTKADPRGATIGCNPTGYLYPEVLTPADQAVVGWGVSAGIDVFSQSFVCHPLDAFSLRCCLANTLNGQVGDIYDAALRFPIIAKIETAPAADPTAARYYTDRLKLIPRERIDRSLREANVHTDPKFLALAERFERLSDWYLSMPILSIVEAFDGVMVARGDLAIEMPKPEVPNLQRRIVRESRRRNKSVIIATEVLTSMQRGDNSTRAEIGDINTAVFQEVDIVMLGGEVAHRETNRYRGKDVVSELVGAIRAAEDERVSIDKERNFETRQREMWKVLPKSDAALRQKIALGARICNAARSQTCPAIFVSVTTGVTAQIVSAFSPKERVIAVTHDRRIARTVLLRQNIHPVLMERPFDHTIDSFVDIVMECQSHFQRDGDWKRARSTCASLIRIDNADRGYLDGNAIASLLVPNTVLEIRLPSKARAPAETEWKFVLSREGYCRLKGALEDRYETRVVHQRNRYFSDRARKLLAAHISIRLRLEESASGEEAQLLLTWKGKESRRSEYVVRPEAEYDVTTTYNNWLRETNGRDFDSFPIDALREYWSSLAGRSAALGIQLQGSDPGVFDQVGKLETERTRATTHTGLSLELDRWKASALLEVRQRFPGIFCERYELEVEDREENEEKVYEVIHDLLAGLGIPVVVGSVPKMVLALIGSGAKDGRVAEEVVAEVRALDAK